MTLDTNNMFYESKGCHMCRMMRVVTIYLCKTALHLYWPIYRNSQYRVVRPWSINSLLWAFIAI